LAVQRSIVVTTAYLQFSPSFLDQRDKACASHLAARARLQICGVTLSSQLEPTSLPVHDQLVSPAFHVTNTINMLSRRTMLFRERRRSRRLGRPLHRICRTACSCWRLRHRRYALGENGKGKPCSPGWRTSRSCANHISIIYQVSAGRPPGTVCPLRWIVRARLPSSSKMNKTRWITTRGKFGG